jgi:hypothetical protein
MSHSKDWPRLRIDYSVEACQLYIKTVEICLGCPDLGILSLKKDIGECLTPNLPSWVPDFQQIARDQKIYRRLGLTRCRPSGILYNAGYDRLNLSPCRFIQIGFSIFEASRWEMWLLVAKISIAIPISPGHLFSTYVVRCLPRCVTGNPARKPCGESSSRIARITVVLLLQD